MNKTDVVIVGGGLAGLALGNALNRAGRDFVLLEARERLGGRIETARVDGAVFDLGPAWFWPGQPRMAAMAKRFGLVRFDQFSQGELIYEDESGKVQRGRGYASMQGSFRLDGGFTALLNALASNLPREAVRLGTAVSALRLCAEGVVVETDDGTPLLAQSVVFAMPPRLVPQISFDPVLPPDVTRVMASVPTWMAGQAKALAVFERPFWRDAGLSGDAMSRYGPMVEVHDASPADERLGALFGFIGVPPAARRDVDALRQAVLAQLGRLFGAQALEPKDLIVKDWALDAFTASDADLAPMYAHSQYGMPAALHGIWDGRIVFGGTEVAREFGGYLEGALEAAETAFETLEPRKVEA